MPVFPALAVYAVRPPSESQNPTRSGGLCELLFSIDDRSSGLPWLSIRAASPSSPS